MHLNGFLNKPRQVEDGSAHLITADLKLAQRKEKIFKD